MNHRHRALYPMMRAMTLKGIGGVEMLALSQVPKVDIAKSTDVLIKVMAAGINRADISQRRGHYNPPPGASEILGLEVAGVVTGVGSDAASRFKEGDRVMALLPGGGYADYALAHVGSVMKVPQGYSFVEAAAVPETFLTAWQILKFHGNLQAGQNVLIHAGASGIGSATAQLTEKYFKARAITTSSADKVEFCRALASASLSRTPDSSGLCFAPKIRSLFGEESIHVVVDPVFGGSYLSENASVLAPGGKLVVIAFMGGSSIEMSGLPLYRQMVHIIFSKLRCRGDDYKAALVSSFEREVMPYLNERIVSPIVSKTFPLTEAASAHTWIEENRGWGKVVLTMSDSTARTIQ